jgi:hypothetical protein
MNNKMKNIYKVAQYYQFKLARKNKLKGFVFDRGDLVYYKGEIGRVSESTPEITKVDFSSSYRVIPTLALEFAGTFDNLLRNEKKITDISPVEIRGDYPPFTDDEETFSRNIFLEENPIYFSRY